MIHPWSARLAWAGTALCLVASWLLLPRRAADAAAAPPVRVVLVDASDSLVAPRPDWLVIQGRRRVEGYEQTRRLGPRLALWKRR